MVPAHRSGGTAGQDRKPSARVLFPASAPAPALAPASAPAPAPSPAPALAPASAPAPAPALYFHPVLHTITGRSWLVGGIKERQLNWTIKKSRYVERKRVLK